MTRNSVIAVAAGALGGALLVAAWQGTLFGVLLGMMFSPLPLAMTAFGLGVVYLPLAIISGAVAVTVLTGSVALAALYLVFDAAPIAILARVGLAAERQAIADPSGGLTPLAGRLIGLPVVILSLLAVAAIGVGAAIFPAGPDGLEAAMVSRAEGLINETGMLKDVPEASRKTLIEGMVRVLPGAAAWNWAFRALVSAVVAQALLMRDGFARWPTPAYRTFAVPGWYVGAFWVAAVAAWLAPGDAGFIVANVAMVMSLPLVLQGLAVVHCAAAYFGLGRVALVGFYAVSLVAAGPAMVLVVALGVMEHFSHLRSRMNAARNGG